MRIPPLVLAGGWEYHRLVGYDDNDLKGLLRGLDRIGATEVLHKKSVSEGMTDDAFLLSLSSLFGQLTGKQMKAMLSAIEGGYYEIPKRTTADDLAGSKDSLGVPWKSIFGKLRARSCWLWRPT